MAALEKALKVEESMIEAGRECQSDALMNAKSC